MFAGHGSVWCSGVEYYSCWKCRWELVISSVVIHEDIWRCVGCLYGKAIVLDTHISVFLIQLYDVQCSRRATTSALLRPAKVYTARTSACTSCQEKGECLRLEGNLLG